MANKVRDWLVKSRKAKLLTQEEVAKTIGISRTSYLRYENGERTPKPKIATKIANILDVDKTKFFWD